MLASFYKDNKINKQVIFFSAPRAKKTNSTKEQIKQEIIQNILDVEESLKIFMEEINFRAY